MALLYFYDATDLDIQQISDGLRDTDHHWEYVRDSLRLDNLNPDTEVLSVFISSHVTKEVLDRLPNLRLIACRSTGYNNIDMLETKSRGITVVNVPTYGEKTVAEYTFMLLLALLRRLPQTMSAVPLEGVALRGVDIFGKMLGVIGAGHIGQHVIQVAKGFGMEVLVYDAFPDDTLALELGFRYVALSDIAKESDVVTLHVPLLPETKHCINAEFLAQMKPSAILVNTARGELIDSGALIHALNDKRIAGAALDVLEGEQLMHLDEEVALLRNPHPPTEALAQSVQLLALQKMPNVIITPHNAFNTVEAIERINATTTQNIKDFWQGVTLHKVEAPKQTSGKLIIARHAESEWNATGQWTGLTDVHLSEKGFHEAALLGLTLKDVVLDQAYCSQQIRTLETLEGILNTSGNLDTPIERSSAINERDYGQYTGKNKWEMRDLVGDDEFHAIRRGWDHPVPDGETLKTVYGRVVPFYRDVVLPQLHAGKNVLLVAHGNSIRALNKYIESISDQNVESLEMVFGTVLLYDLDDAGRILHKVERSIDSPPPNA
jgi:D-lactate dehydrogenase